MRSPRAKGEATMDQVRETMTAAIELSADGFLQQINEYECIRDLGSGATAEVKLCRRVDKQTGEEEWVAVKVFNKSLLNRQARGFAFGRRKKDPKRDSQVLQNVRREVALMKKLVHPNVVRLLEVIDDPKNDLLFMAMEFVHNGPVMVWDEDTGQYLSPATGGVLPPKTAAVYFRGMLDGLEFLHGNHVVHRDLKPENVLLTKDGVAKLADFGVAQVFDEQEIPPAAGGGGGSSNGRGGSDSPSAPAVTPESAQRHRHQLTQPEGTWCFWAPEICTSSTAANERALMAAEARAKGAEAAKALALGSGVSSEPSPLISMKTPSPIMEGEVFSSTNDGNGNSNGLDGTGSASQGSGRHSLQRQGTYNAFAADVWAAGVCLWVFRFGTPPFYNADPSNLFVEICRQPLLFPRSVDEGDEEVLKQEAKEARRRARRAAAAAKAAAAEADQAALEAAEELATRRGVRRGSSGGGEEDDVPKPPPCLRPIQIPEDGDAEVDDMISPGQLPALGSRQFGGGRDFDDGSGGGGTHVPNGRGSTRRTDPNSPAVHAPLRRSQSSSHGGGGGSGGRARRSVWDTGSGGGVRAGGGGGGMDGIEQRGTKTPPALEVPPTPKSRTIPPDQEWFGRRPSSGNSNNNNNNNNNNSNNNNRPQRSGSGSSDKSAWSAARSRHGSASSALSAAADAAMSAVLAAVGPPLAGGGGGGSGGGGSSSNASGRAGSGGIRSGDRRGGGGSGSGSGSGGGGGGGLNKKQLPRRSSHLRSDSSSGGMVSTVAPTTATTPSTSSRTAAATAPSFFSSSSSMTISAASGVPTPDRRASSSAGVGRSSIRGGGGSGGGGKAPPTRSVSSPLMVRDEMFSSAEITGYRRVGGTGSGSLGEKATAAAGAAAAAAGAPGTLRNLLSSLLHKKVSERTTVREAQEHPWMRRMASRTSGDGAGLDGRGGGTRRGQPPPFKQVSVTAGEVKGAIVHINSLFVISMVKSRLTQRLTRARKNIARRRQQATTGNKYGPSLSDTEQEHLREVRELTEALTKDEAVLINHDLANEPERSLSDSDLPTATCSGTWGGRSGEHATGDGGVRSDDGGGGGRQRERRGGGGGGSGRSRSGGGGGRSRSGGGGGGGGRSRGSGGGRHHSSRRSASNVGTGAALPYQLYARSASRVAGRAGVHDAITNFFGAPGAGGSGSVPAGDGTAAASRSAGYRTRGAGAGDLRDEKERSSRTRSRGGRRRRSREKLTPAEEESIHTATAAAAAGFEEEAPPSGGVAGLTGLTSLSKSLSNQLPVTSAPPAPAVPASGFGPAWPIPGLASMQRNASGDSVVCLDGSGGHGVSRRTAGSGELFSSPPSEAAEGGGQEEAEGITEAAAVASAAAATEGSKSRAKIYSRARSIRSISIASTRGFDSSSGSDSGSFSSDFTPTDEDDDDYDDEYYDDEDDRSSEVSERETREKDALSMLRYANRSMANFGSEGSSPAGNNQRTRSSFRVFGIKRRTLKIKQQIPKMSRMSISRSGSNSRREREGGSGAAAGRHPDPVVDDGVGIRGMVMAMPMERKLTSDSPSRISGRLSGGVLGMKRGGGAGPRNGKSPARHVDDSGISGGTPPGDGGTRRWR